MGVFEYLGVILSVIMGLGVTHILAGLSKTIHHRTTVKIYWVQTLWAFNILIYFFTVLTLAWCVDVPETMAKSESGLRDLPEAYIVLATTNILLAAGGAIWAIWANKAHHKFYAVFWPVFTLGYLSMTTLAEIAARGEAIIAAYG